MNPDMTGAPRHKCPIDGCRAMVLQHLLMCSHHWSMVPRNLQVPVLVTWKHGPTSSYLTARRKAIGHVNQTNQKAKQ